MFDFLWSCSYHKATIGQWRCEIPIIMKRPPHNSMKPTMNPMRYQWHSLHTGFLGKSHLLTELCSPYRTAHLIQTKTTKTSWYIELVFCCWIVRKHKHLLYFSALLLHSWMNDRYVPVLLVFDPIASRSSLSGSPTKHAHCFHHTIFDCCLPYIPLA